MGPLQRMAKDLNETTSAQEIACHGCDRRSSDGDDLWNLRTIPYRNTEYVCQVCFSGTRQPWRERFKLSEKLKFGIVHTPLGYPTSELDVLHASGVPSDHSQQSSQSTQITYPKPPRPYAYSPLGHNEIRVLDILPGEGEHDVCCALRHIRLDVAEVSRYEALSYHWESTGGEMKTIWIDGCTFVVSESLSMALRCIRDPHISRTFWIDAISINQGQDIDEKMIQIGLMGRIYQNAFEVIIWLGPASKTSDSVMDAIVNYDIHKIRSEQFANGFTELLARSWFFRTWTIQEFVLCRFPPRIQCGTRFVSSGQFLAVRNYLDEYRHCLGEIKAGVGWQSTGSTSLPLKDDLVLTHPTTMLLDCRSAALDSEGAPIRRSLARILRYYIASRVTNIADKVYGTLGLVDEVVHDHIKASGTTSVSETYTEAMTYMFNVETESHDTEVLELYLTFPCSLTVSSPIPGLPSWVPDFSRNEVFLDLSTKYVWFWLYQTTRSDARKPKEELQHGRHLITTKRIERSMFKAYDNVLSVKGFLVDDIAEVVPSAFCQDFITDSVSSLDWFFEYTDESQQLREQFKPLLDLARTSGAGEKLGNLSDGVSLQALAWQVGQMLQSTNLQQVEKTCRKFAKTLGVSIPEDEWMTDIWSDLFEGYGSVPKLSREEFRAGFYYLAGSRSPRVPPYYATNDAELLAQLREEGTSAALELEVPFKQVFNTPKCFFMTESSGVYGIGPTGVRNRDKVALLFPPFYMAFILRPEGTKYHLVGPCFVPPVRRDAFMRKAFETGREMDEFHIV